MRDIEKYYNSTKDAKPNYTVQKFIELDIQPGKAVELGCGAGRDTVYLIKHGWNVTAMDRENVESIIKKRLSENEIKQLRFLRQDFEHLEIEKNNLVVANFSLPFCNQDNFKIVWNKIENSLLKNGYFAGNFFGIRDEWRETKKEMTFFTKEEVMELLKHFEIIEFKEIEKDGVTGLGNMKHWHIFHVIAKKSKI